MASPPPAVRRIGDGQATRRRVDAAVLLQRDKSRKAPNVGVDDPWGWGRSLEWATSSPPPRHNFEKLPRIRSESPAFDLHYPHVSRTRTPHDQTDGDNLLVAGGSQSQIDHQVAQQNVGTDLAPPDEV